MQASGLRYNTATTQSGSLETSALKIPSVIIALGNVHQLLLSVSTLVPALCHITGHLLSRVYLTGAHSLKCFCSSPELLKHFVLEHRGPYYIPNTNLVWSLNLFPPSLSVKALFPLISFGRLSVRMKKRESQRVQNFQTRK